jgi:uncharacterized membrane protein YGL010W
MGEKLDVIAHVIQLAIAPVFLLTGIGELLGVMTNRLARIVDRARTLEDQHFEADEPQRKRIDDQLRQLARRARLTNRAITLLVLAALLVCTVIVGLFVTAYYAWSPDLTRVVATLFAAAMLALIIGLLTFLREVYLATQTLRIGHRP